MKFITDEFFHRLGILFLFLLLCSAVRSQTANDSTQTSIMTKSPRKAMLLSSLCPGAGQWYNEQKIKSFIVLGGQAALVVNAAYYNQKLSQSTDDDERDFYEFYRSMFVWYSVGFYLLNIVDAFVDAHLFHFDVSPELTESAFIPSHRQYKVAFSLPVQIFGDNDE